MEDKVIADFRKKTDMNFHLLDGMTAGEIEQIVLFYVQAKIIDYDIDAKIENVVLSGSRCRGIEEKGSNLDVVALVAGLGEACRLAETEYEQNIAAYKEKKDAVLELIEKSGIKYEINGNQDYCMPNTINLSITGVESEALMLSSKQFCGISNGSACTSHEYSPSYVLTAMGLDADRISSAIRISWGAHTDKDELINELSELIAVAKSLVF